jgi:hypothetical protein
MRGGGGIRKDRGAGEAAEKVPVFFFSCEDFGGSLASYKRFIRGPVRRAPVGFRNQVDHPRVSKRPEMS